MSALTAPRTLTTEYGVGLAQFGIAANTVIFPGALVGLNSSGYAIPAALAATCIKIVGVYTGVSGGPVSNLYGQGTADNTGGAANAFLVSVNQGAFNFNMGAGGDAMTIANIGATVYASDDNTVNLTDGAATRVSAGKLINVVGTQAIIQTGIVVAGSSADLTAQPISIVNVPVTLSLIANAGVVARFTPGFQGRIVSLAASVTTVATTAAKLATLTPAIATVATTGGALALTSANCTPLGAGIAASAITALNQFTSAQEITIVGSGVTTFVEGAVNLYLAIQPN